jgi:hypothetical protein
MLFAWTPTASAASWSTGICNPPPTYGPYSISGNTKYYCPAAGSFVPTTALTGGMASDIMKCTDPLTQPGCVVVTDEIQLLADANSGPNVAIQCRVPGATTCKGNKCGGSPDSSGAVFLKQIFFGSVSSPVDSSACTREKGSGAIKCTKSNRFGGLEQDPEAAAQYCPNAGWEITKWLALKLYTSNVIQSADGSLLKSYHYCELKDPQNLLPGDEGYSPDLNTPSNNSYVCEDRDSLPIPPPQ